MRKKWITFLTTLLLGSGASYASANVGQVDFEAGYRCDNISWTHKAPAYDPILSTHSKFKDIDIFQIGINGRTTIGCNFYVRGNAYWGWILDGDYKQRFSTYGTNTILDEDSTVATIDGFGFSLANKNVIDDKYVYGIGAAVGYPFFFCDCSMVLAPVLGYSFDEQSICLEDEGIDLYASNGVLFPVSGSGCCSHKFITRWYGPFVGVDFSYRPYNDCWSFYAELEYHWGHFKGRRHARGFDLLDDSNHSSDRARGWTFAAGADYDLPECDWTIGLSVKFQDRKASRHHRHDGFNDYSGFSGGGRGRSNHKWHSYAINLTLGREF
jgi:hypothetical protein